MINTMDELLAYLDEMTNRAKTAAGYNVVANVESICAQMWKQCTPHALTFWTTAGVLQHVADCLSPRDDDTSEDDGEES